MATVLNDITDVDVLLALTPEELAPIVLRTSKQCEQNGLMHIQYLSHFVLDQPGQPPRYPLNRRNEVEKAINEGWSWLSRNGMIVPDAGYNGTNGFMVLTRLGVEVLSNPDGFGRYRAGIAFPKALLHPAIAEKVWNALVRGELEDAVFAAFKAVEIAVRDAGNFTTADIGVALMRKAFDKTSGPLTDSSQPEAEREALAHLFAGAIGSYKNPHSHRTVTITDPRDAQEMVMLASHLLGIVEARRK